MNMILFQKFLGLVICCICKLCVRIYLFELILYIIFVCKMMYVDTMQEYFIVIIQYKVDRFLVRWRRGLSRDTSREFADVF